MTVINRMERQLLVERLKDFHKDVLPVELLPYLPCLTSMDKEKIDAKSRNEGPTIANQLLVNCLIKREHGFIQFVQALKTAGFYQVALLFDPSDEVEPPEDCGDVGSDGKGFNIIGTAIDIELKCCLQVSVAGDVDVPRELEKEVAEKFRDSKSEETRNLRLQFRKFLPRGTAFVHTKKGSVVSIFRVSTVAAVEELRRKYESEELQLKMQELLIDPSFPSDVEKENFRFCVEFPKEKFEKIHDKLEEIQQKQQLLGEDISVIPGNTEEDTDIAFEDFQFPQVYLENGRSLEQEELKPRTYQLELAQKAIEGENTIICAPTNSGKTYVALHIVKEHLRRYQEAKKQGEDMKGPSVIFVVSTVNLVLQQKQRFERFLQAKIDDISGANSNDLPLKHVLMSHEVVIITAQILVNALQRSDDQRVDLSDISMLIFDECHHANKDHAYNKIMERYIALKMQPNSKRPKLPQVIGFTASLGVGKANKSEDAQKHIMQICANLDASSVTTVHENRKELDEYVNMPTRKIHSVKRTGRDPFKKIIDQVMARLEDRVKRFQDKEYLAAPPGRSGQQYRQWVEELDKKATSASNRCLVTLAEQLREYHIALEINSSTRMQDAMKRLETYFDNLDEGKMIEMDRQLKRLYEKARALLKQEGGKNGFPENPKLARLRILILENYPRDSKGDNQETGDETMEEAGQEEPGEQPDKGKEGVEPGNENGDEEDEETRKESHEDSSKEYETHAAPKSEQEEPGEQRLGEKGGGELGNENGEEEDEKTREESHEEPSKERETDTAPKPEQEEPGEQPLGEKGGEEPGNENGEEKDEKTREESHEEPSKERETDTAPKPEDEAASEETEGAENCPTESKTPADQGAKGIVFTRTRESTEALLEWINDSPELRTILKPEILVGSGDAKIGMTQRKQESIIDKFKSGACNIILATTVAEEGLDISDCNYVIRYDMMGNEISSVQSRGRVRAKEGNYTVLVDLESGALKRNDKNQFREMLMEEAVARVQKINRDEFKQRVQILQEKACMDRRLKKNFSAAKKSQFDPNDVTFFCRKCSTEACQAHEMRRFQTSYHVVITPDFAEKVVVKPKIAETYDGVTMNQKIFCKECKQDWGVTVLINGGEWCCLKISYFALKMRPSARNFSMFKKWKDAPFPVEEVSTNELLRMSREKGEGDAIDDLDFEEFAE